MSGLGHDELVAAFREAEQYAERYAAGSLGMDSAAYFYLAAYLNIDVDAIRGDVS